MRSDAPCEAVWSQGKRAAMSRAHEAAKLRRSRWLSRHSEVLKHLQHSWGLDHSLLLPSEQLAQLPAY